MTDGDDDDERRDRSNSQTPLFDDADDLRAISMMPRFSVVSSAQQHSTPLFDSPPPTATSTSISIPSASHRQDSEQPASSINTNIIADSSFIPATATTILSSTPFSTSTTKYLNLHRVHHHLQEHTSVPTTTLTCPAPSHPLSTAPRNSSITPEEDATLRNNSTTNTSLRPTSGARPENQTSDESYHNVSQSQELFVRVFWFGWRSMNVGQLLLSMGVIGACLFVILRFGSITCYPMMYRWMVVQIALAAVQALTAITILCTIPSIYDTEASAIRRARQATVPFAITRFITSAFVGWQMVGIASLAVAPDGECVGRRGPGEIDWVYTAAYFNILINVSLLIIYAAFWLCIPCAIMLYYAQDPSMDEENGGGGGGGGGFFTTSNRRGASQEVINGLPRTLYDSKLHGSGCVICLTDYSAGEIDICRLPCGHSFHYVCTVSWLLRNAVCPQCRMVVVTVQNGTAASQDDGQASQQRQQPAQASQSNSSVDTLLMIR